MAGYPYQVPLGLLLICYKPLLGTQKTAATFRSGEVAADVEVVALRLCRYGAVKAHEQGGQKLRYTAEESYH